MTRSIFDPTGGETERSGNRFTPPDAQQDSHMPTDVVDGVVNDEEDDETIVPAGLGDPVPNQPAANNSMTTAESTPGVEAPADRPAPAQSSTEASPSDSGIE